MGAEIGYANWIPTYAAKAGFATLEAAGSISSIYWIFITVGRFAMLYWKGTVESRLRILLKGHILCVSILFVLQLFGMYEFVAYSGAISSAFCLSAMYALFFSIAIDYGYGLTASNTANFAMSASLGEGLLVMPTGMAMGAFGFEALVILLFIMSIIMHLLY